MAVKPVVVITGASEGIGRALALAWAKRGFRVVLFARRAEELAQVAAEVSLAGGAELVVVGDVTSSEDARRLVSETQRVFGRIDVLVNNAGRGYYTTIRETDPEQLLELFRLNVVAPMQLAQLAMPMLLASEGTIVMLSSIAGVAATPRVGAYAATKFALEAVSQALRAELHASGVRVLVARPGPVRTRFRRNAAVGLRDPGFQEDDQRQSADAVANSILRAVSRGQAELETSRFVRASSLLARCAPAVFRRVTARMAKRYGL